MPSNHLILCCPLLLLPSIFPSIRVFSNESALHIRWPKYWSFSFNISPSNEYPGLIFRMDWLDLLAVKETLKSLLQQHSSKASILQCSAFFIVQLSHPYMTTGKTTALTRWIAGSQHMQRGLMGKASQASGVPPGFSWTFTPQNQSLPALLYCAFHSPDILWKKLTQGFSLVHMKGMFQLTQGFSLLHMKGMFQLKPLWWLSNLPDRFPWTFTICELLTAPRPWEAQSLKHFKDTEPFLKS